MSINDAPSLLAEGRVREGELEYECPRCQLFLTLGRNWSPGWTILKSCPRCDSMIEVIRGAPEFAPDEPLVVQPRKETPVPIEPTPPPSPGAVTVVLLTITVVLAAVLGGGRQPLLQTAALVMGALSVVVAARYLAARRRHTEEQRVKRARQYMLCLQEASMLTHDLRKELDRFRADAARLRSTGQRAGKMLPAIDSCWNGRVRDTFWKEVLAVERELGECAALSRHLVWRDSEYVRRLHDREHTFPPAPLVPAELPQLSELYEHAVRVVRQAETEPGFAAAMMQHYDEATLSECGPISSVIENAGWIYADQYGSLRESFSRSSIPRLPRWLLRT